jgi:hypothetical protein
VEGAPALREKRGIYRLREAWQGDWGPQIRAMKRNTPLDLFTGPLIVLGGRACCEMMRTMLVALALSGLVGGPAVAEVVNGTKLLAECRDGDDPSARDSPYKWGTCFDISRAWRTRWFLPGYIACPRLTRSWKNFPATR